MSILGKNTPEIINCHRCGNEVNSERIVCNHCGADMRNHPKKQVSTSRPDTSTRTTPPPVETPLSVESTKTKKMSLKTKLAIGCAMIVMFYSMKPTPEATTNPAAAPTTIAESNAQPNPEELQKKEQAKKEDRIDSARIAMTRIIIKAIKGSLRDPNSLEWDQIYANNAGTAFCFEYRARNGFGGMNREIMVVVNGKTSQSASAWNKHCTGKGFKDYTILGKW